MLEGGLGLPVPFRIRERRSTSGMRFRQPGFELQGGGVGE
jgi:hypothetical protein